RQVVEDDEGILDLLTEEERGRFLREVTSGRLGKLIVPWVPWWTQAAGAKRVAAGAGEGAKVAAAAADVGSSCTRHSFAALLSQAFRSPDFSTICGKQPSPTLPALATDLAYAYVLTSRLYNGCWCSDPVGASLALVGASPVLRDGATPATVVQALTACVERA
ncbi:unnamed protein product, partial [Hapterophycus canaliculatus]